LAVPSAFLGCTTFGSFGAFVPDLPGVPVYDFLNLSGPTAMCGDGTVAILPALVAPADATSDMISLIFIILFTAFKKILHFFRSAVFCVWHFKVLFPINVAYFMSVHH
jgi:hypothetical protein